MDLHTLYC
ncbi:hypothetical protein ID866_7690 [Astraeus odoratus]|nr:hypothetical protein ID866_7690 [Astraeus odoratus]